MDLPMDWRFHGITIYLFLTNTSIHLGSCGDIISASQIHTDNTMALLASLPDTWIFSSLVCFLFLKSNIFSKTKETCPILEFSVFVI